jgi:hypothetical protein
MGSINSKQEQIKQLKKELRDRISKFCSKSDVAWKAPILQTLHEIKEHKWPAVIFGGTIRSLLLGSGKNRRPRDIDIVLNSVSINKIESLFSESIIRQTRFGGVKIQRDDLEFDLWPIDKTWAYVKDNSKTRTYENLPKTTFLNIEAIAIDIWPQRGHKRSIYTDNDSFFYAILSKTLEINREENPFPMLCVVRSLIMATKLRFKLGSNLSKYIEKYGSMASSNELEEVQLKHYGKVKIQGNTLLEWIDYIKTARKRSEQIIALPMSYQQLSLVNDIDQHLKSKIHVYCD